MFSFLYLNDYLKKQYLFPNLFIQIIVSIFSQLLHKWIPTHTHTNMNACAQTHDVETYIMNLLTQVNSYSKPWNSHRQSHGHHRTTLHFFTVMIATVWSSCRPENLNIYISCLVLSRVSYIPLLVRKSEFSCKGLRTVLVSGLCCCRGFRHCRILKNLLVGF